MENNSRRFRFDRDADVALINAIMLAEVHNAKTGERREEFNSPYNMFCSSPAETCKIERGMPKPKSTTIQEHYRELVKDRRAANRSSIAVSGVAEEYGELEEVLDNVIREIDKKCPKEGEKKEAEERKEQELKDAAKETR